MVVQLTAVGVGENSVPYPLGPVHQRRIGNDRGVEGC